MIKINRRETLGLGVATFLSELIIGGGGAFAQASDTLTIAYNVNLPSFDPTTGPSAVNPTIQPKMPFRTPDDFAPISLLVTVPELMVITPSHPAKTVAELVAMAKAQPGKLFYASSGNGTTLHLSGELFKLTAGVDIQHVPYKGGGPAMLAVIAGEDQLMFSSIVQTVPAIQSGQLRALATGGAQRSPIEQWAAAR